MKIPKARWAKIEEAAYFIANEDDKHHLKAKLDFSDKSITRLDRMFNDIWGNDGGPSEDTIDTFNFIYGSYLALVIDKNFYGTWNLDKNTGFIQFNNKSEIVGAQPWTWVAKRFELFDDIWSKYKFFSSLSKSDRR